MKKLLLLLILMPFFMLGCSQNKNDRTIYIADVHDGDTFKDSVGNSYRILGADTPEVSSGKNFTPTMGIENIYATQATNFTRNLINHKKIRIKEIKKDKYSRIVAMVFIDGTNSTLSLELVKRGLARVAYVSLTHTNTKFFKSPDYYISDSDYYKKLYEAQYEASRNKRGFWQESNSFNTIFPKAS